MFFDTQDSQEGLRLLGFEDVQQSLIHDFNNHKLHHAIILSGNYGIGKSNFAKLLTQTLLVNHNQGNFADQIAKIKSNSHPDLLYITRRIDPKTKKLKRDINIDEIRKINNFLNLTATFSQNRVIIIDDIDSLNKNAANALLKNLEEPPENCFFILINHNLSKILPTILSRCKIVKIPNLSDANFYQIIKSNNKNIKKNHLQFYSSLTNNSPALTLQMIENKILKIYQQICQIIYQKDHNLLAKLIEKKSTDDQNYHNLSELISYFLSKASKINYVNDNFIDQDEEDALNCISNSFNFEQLFDLTLKINHLINNTKTLNLDKKTTINNIFSLIL